MTAHDSSSIDPTASLLEMQRIFTEIIRRPLSDGDRMTPDDRTAHFITGNAVLTPHERLELYAQQYWWRLLGALEDDFPTLRVLLGPVKFRETAECYLSAYPSTSFTLRHLGRRFVEFLTARPRLLGPRPGRALDVARFEWALVECFEAEERAPLSAAELAEIDSERDLLSVRPAVRALALSYPVDKLFFSLKQDRSSNDEGNSTHAERRQQGVSSRSVDPSSLIRERTYLVVHRSADTLYTRRVPRLVYHLLRLNTEGRSLQTLLAELQERHLIRSSKDLQDAFRIVGELGLLTCAS